MTDNNNITDTTQSQSSNITININNHNDSSSNIHNDGDIAIQLSTTTSLQSNKIRKTQLDHLIQHVSNNTLNNTSNHTVNSDVYNSSLFNNTDILCVIYSFLSLPEIMLMCSLVSKVWYQASRLPVVLANRCITYNTTKFVSMSETRILRHLERYKVLYNIANEIRLIVAFTSKKFSSNTLYAIQQIYKLYSNITTLYIHDVTSSYAIVTTGYLPGATMVFINEMGFQRIFNNLQLTNVTKLYFDKFGYFDCKYIVSVTSQQWFCNIVYLQLSDCKLYGISEFKRLPSLKQIDLVNVSGKLYINDFNGMHQQHIIINLINNTKNNKYLIIADDEVSQFLNCILEPYNMDIDTQIQHYNTIKNMCNTINYLPVETSNQQPAVYDIIVYVNNIFGKVLHDVLGL